MYDNGFKKASCSYKLATAFKCNFLNCNIPIKLGNQIPQIAY